MKTILFHSEKGGTGKTTLSTLYAAYRAMVGDNVLLLDTDGQAHATTLMGIEEAPGLFECLVRGVPIADRWRRPHPETWIPGGHEPKGDLYVLPGNQESVVIPMLVDAYSDAFTDRLNELQGIDTVVIDSGPSGGGMMSLVWGVADYVIIPTILERLGIQALASTIDRARRANVELLGIVPNMVDLRTLLHQHYHAELATAADDYGWRVFAPLWNRIEWAESSHLMMQLYAVQSNMSKARLEAIKFCQQVDKAMVTARGVA